MHTHTHTVYVPSKPHANYLSPTSQILLGNLALSLRGAADGSPHDEVSQRVVAQYLVCI